MKNGKLIAISSLTTALAIVFLIIGAYFQSFDLSALFMASLMMTIPLAKGSKKGFFLSYLATSVLAFVFTISRFYLAVLFLLFFGIHPFINYIQANSAKKLWFLYIIKGVWFIGVCYLMVYAFSMFVAPNDFIQKILPYFVFVFGALCYIVYDFVIFKFQKMMVQVIKRLGV